MHQLNHKIKGSILARLWANLLRQKYWIYKKDAGYEIQVQNKNKMISSKDHGWLWVNEKYIWNDQQKWFYNQFLFSQKH